MSKKGCDCDYQMLVSLVIGIGGGFLAGFALGWMWRDRPGALASVSLLSVLTAFGTCGAVFVAVGLHTSRLNSSKARALLRAKMYALEMKVSLQYFGNIADVLTKIMLTTFQQEAKLEDIRRLADLSSRIMAFSKVLETDFLTLAPIGKGIPQKLIIGISQIHQGAMAVNELVSHFTAEELQAGVQVEDVMRAFVWVSGGTGIFKGAESELASISNDFLKSETRGKSNAYS